MMELGVEGMMLSPGYTYDKAPDQEHFLSQEKTRELFRQILSNRHEKWRFNLSPLFLEFLMGKRDYKCTPWGMPTYNIFGWQKPCYLLQDGYADTFEELIRETDWDRYGTESGNPKCANCMVHSGYEASAVNDTFGSLGGFLSTVRATLFQQIQGSRCDGRRFTERRQRFRPARADCHVAESLTLHQAPMLDSNHFHSAAEAAEEHLGVVHENLEGWVPASRYRVRNPRSAGKSVRLSRRFDDHAEGRAEGRRVRIRSQDQGSGAHRLLHPADAERQAGQSFPLPTAKSPASRSPAATPLRERALPPG